MDWGQVLTIIFGTAGFMGIFMLLVNKRIDSVEKRVYSLESELREFRREIKEELKEIRYEIREIRELLYKVLGTETKKE